MFVFLAEASLSLVGVDTCSVMDRQGRQTKDLFDRKPVAGVERRFRSLDSHMPLEKGH